MEHSQKLRQPVTRFVFLFFFNDTATTEIYTLSLHDALPICLTLEPTKTKLVEFGRFAQRHASKRGRNRPQTIYFLGFTLYCTRNRKGNFRVGLRTETPPL